MKKDILKKVVIISLIGNIILTIIKLLIGAFGKSHSLISDGINSFSDIIVSILLLVVIKISNKSPDKNHNYGHEKYEGVMYLFLSFIMLVTGVLFIYTGVSNIINFIKDKSSIVKPEIYTVFGAIIALIIKFILFTLTSYTGKKFQSNSLKADAKNHLFDMVSTFTSLIGVSLAQFNLLYFEQIATIIIAAIIISSAISMIKDAVSYLVDEAPSKETVKSIKSFILSLNGVNKIDDIKIRKHMNFLYVDVEISVNSNLSLIDAHKIAESVHLEVENNFSVLHCMVHVNPDKNI